MIIKLETTGDSIELTLDEARDMYNELKQLFDNSVFTPPIYVPPYQDHGYTPPVYKTPPTWFNNENSSKEHNI